MKGSRRARAEGYKFAWFGLLPTLAHCSEVSAEPEAPELIWVVCSAYPGKERYTIRLGNNGEGKPPFGSMASWVLLTYEGGLTPLMNHCSEAPRFLCPVKRWYNCIGREKNPLSVNSRRAYLTLCPCPFISCNAQKWKRPSVSHALSILSRCSERMTVATASTEWQKSRIQTTVTLEFNW